MKQSEKWDSCLTVNYCQVDFTLFEDTIYDLG